VVRSIEDVEREHLLGIVSYSMVTPNTYHAKTISGEELLIKIKRRPTINNLFKDFGIAGFYYYLSTPLKREAIINDELTKSEFLNFDFPRMLHTDYCSYIVFEYIKNCNCNLLDIAVEKVVKSLIEFQSISINKKTKLYKTASSVLRSISVSTVKGIVVIGPKKLGVVTTISAIREVAKMLKLQKKLKQGWLLHKDFERNANYLVTDDRKIYFIDFEMTAIEKRWIMTDIVDLAWDVENMSIDHDLITEYLKEIDEIYDKSIELLTQARLILLRKAVYFIRGTKYSQEMNKQIINFIKDVLLDARSFELWYYSGLEKN